MLENTFSWKVDHLARTDILDLDFVMSDLVDIPITDAEQMESAMYDALATLVAERAADKSNTPNGKQVF
jgi:hypothetical protein